MRNLKKLLAVIVSVCVLATFALPAFAAEKTAAEICEDLGVLKGDSSEGVTDTYLAKGTNRMQAALLFLRLIGKEDEALAFEGEDNFADAEDTWAAARPVLAYLKANPELGWQGVSPDKFNPKGKFSAQQMYKVCLEVLGYKQGEDFEWADVFTFAAEKGLSEIADVTDLTNNDVAIALVEVLKLTLKDSETTLIADLVEKGVVAEADAIAAGLIEEVVPVALDVDSISAKTNTRIDIILKTAATEVDETKLAIKDAAGTALAITSATLSADGKSVKVITAAQTVGTKYTFTIEGTDYTFIGQMADTTKPEVSLAASLTNTLVEVTFTEDMDDNALVAGNYTIADLTVESVAFKSGSKKVVQLTTSAQTANKLYKVVVANATDIAGNVINGDKDEFLFGGRPADTSKPTLNTIVTPHNGNKVIVSFTDENMLDVATLGDIANYAIEGLEISAVKILSNEIGLSGKKEVELTTADQTASKLYYVSVKNVKDTVGNTMDTAKVPFGGSSKDTDKLNISLVVAETNTSVKVTFNDIVDAATATNIANYAIEGLTITAVAEDADATKATNDNEYLRTSVYVLTTSAQTANKLYYLKTKNLMDDAGNAQAATELSVPFGGKAADTTKPVAASAISIDKNTVQVSFTEDGGLDAASAKNPANYLFDGGLGYATKATLSGTVVTLTTAPQTASKSYKVTVSGVKDKSGNVMDSKDLTFIGKGDTDTAAPKVESVIALDKNTVQVTFTKAIAYTGTAADFDITASTKSGYTLGNADTATLLSDNKTMLLTFTTNPLENGYVYDLTVTATNIANINDSTQKLYTASSANVVKFAGSSAENARPAISAVIATDSTHLKVIFSEPMKAGVAEIQASTLNLVGRNGGSGDAPITTASWQATSSDQKEVTYKLAAELPSTDSVFKAFIADVTKTTDLTDKTVEGATTADTGASKAGVQFAKSTDTAAALKIDFIQGVDEYTVDIYFNQDVTFTELATDTNFCAITDQNGGALGTAPVFDHAIKIDAKVIRAFFKTNKFVSGVYTLTIASGASGTDLVTNVDAVALGTADGANKKVFAASTDAQAKIKIAAVEAIAYNKVKVTFNQLVDTTATATEIASDLTITAPGATIPAVTATLGTDGKSVILQLSNGMFSADDEYTVAITAADDLLNVARAANTADTTSTAKFRGLFTPAISVTPATANVATTTTFVLSAKLSDGRALETADLTAAAAVASAGDEMTATALGLTAGEQTITVTKGTATVDETTTFKYTVNGTSKSVTFVATAK